MGRKWRALDAHHDLSTIVAIDVEDGAVSVLDGAAMCVGLDAAGGH